jgi:hypothetical protein
MPHKNDAHLQNHCSCTMNRDMNDDLDQSSFIEYPCFVFRYRRF